jgi:hypothetical protein
MSSPALDAALCTTVRRMSQGEHVHNLSERPSRSRKVHERVDQNGAGGHRHHADGEVVSQMFSLKLMKTARPA